jgi:DNA-binding MarR family transcriptional regulator
MVFRLRLTDCGILRYIADYRILTVSQLAAVLRKNKQAVTRRLTDLEKQGLIQTAKRQSGRTRGRPEKIVGLSEYGLDILKKKNLIGKDIEYDIAGPVSIRQFNHQLLLNWFRIHLNEYDRIEPRPALQFLSFNSPFVPRGEDGRVIISDCSPVGQRTVRQVRFTPDAVFAFTNAAGDKSILLFVEIDCGTETLASPQRDMSDIRQKILNYQWYFDSQRYKRYEYIFQTQSLRGFRLLFLTATAERLAALCRLTEQMQPSDFIWLSERNRMFAEGAFWNIWAVGGNLHAPQQSIMGSLVCRLPLKIAGNRKKYFK